MLLRVEREIGGCAGLPEGDAGPEEASIVSLHGILDGALPSRTRLVVHVALLFSASRCSVSRRAFSIAITCWRAETMFPIASPSRNRGTSTAVGCLPRPTLVANASGSLQRGGGELLQRSIDRTG